MAAWTRWTGRRASSWGPPPCRRSWRPARASGCRWGEVSRHHTRDSCGLQNGECELPLGANTVGLIYVNPEGHLADGDPEQSARDIREVFARWGALVRVMMVMALLARMGMDDEEAVALIGGGHGVGKAHGACPLGAGPAPSEDPFNPWPGRCGAGKLEEAFTSGLELPWTTRPTSWDNEFFSNLLDYDWELHEVNTRASNQALPF